MLCQFLFIKEILFVGCNRSFTFQAPNILPGVFYCPWWCKWKHILMWWLCTVITKVYLWWGGWESWPWVKEPGCLHQLSCWTKPGIYFLYFCLITPPASLLPHSTYLTNMTYQSLFCLDIRGLAWSHFNQHQRTNCWRFFNWTFVLCSLNHN